MKDFIMKVSKTFLLPLVKPHSPHRLPTATRASFCKAGIPLMLIELPGSAMLILLSKVELLYKNTDKKKHNFK